MRLQIRLRPRRRGGAIVGTLFFILITSILLMGIGSYTVLHRSRAEVDSNYARAIDLADAGVNYEIKKISGDPHQADINPTTYTLGEGSFTVYCANQTGNPTPWSTDSDSVYIYSTGTINGVSRQVRVGARSTGGSSTQWSTPFNGTDSSPVLRLIPQQNPNPQQYRIWRVRNPQYMDVRFRISVYYSGWNLVQNNIVAKARTETWIVWSASTPVVGVHFPDNALTDSMTTKVEVDGNQSGTVVDPNGVSHTYNYTDAQSDGNMIKASNKIPGGSMPTSGSGTFNFDNSWVEVNGMER